MISSSTDVTGKCHHYEQHCAIFNMLGSLQATWIRNSLLHALRSSAQSNTRLVTANVVYEHPSISALADFASRFALPAGQDKRQESASKVQEMLSMVKIYSQSFPKHHPSVATPSEDVVMVTGTTGGFGSVLLAQLVASNDVTRVFAVNRKDPNGATLSNRQAASLERQGLDPAIVFSSKVTLVEADLSMSALGLASEVFEPVCHHVSLWTLADNAHRDRSIHLSHISFITVRWLVRACETLLICVLQHGASILILYFSLLNRMSKECAT
jgi:hypothetical protein